MKRRQVIKLSLASLAAPIILNAGLANAGSVPESVRFVIQDPAIQASRQFASNLANTGTEVISLRGDIGQQWFRSLRTTLQASRGPIAGMTDELTLFCLEQLGRDLGLKVVDRIDSSLQERAVNGARLVSWLMA